MKKDKTFISILKKITRDIPCSGNQTLASCIVKGNRVISFGHNQRKTHPLQTKFAKNPEAIYLHAEIDAIKNALKEVDSSFLEQCTLYIARTKKNGDEGISKPCKGCNKAIEAFGIRRVVYTTEKENIYGEMERKR
jgi:tRNA(Arg) A34 adenosine deaminase TadA